MFLCVIGLFVDGFVEFGDDVVGIKGFIEDCSGEGGYIVGMFFGGVLVCGFRDVRSGV